MLDALAVKLGREKFDEIEHETTHECPFSKAHVRHARLEQMACVDGHEIGVEFGVPSHMRDDPDSKAEADVGLDDVCIGGSEDDARG